MHALAPGLAVALLVAAWAAACRSMVSARNGCATYATRFLADDAPLLRGNFCDSGLTDNEIAADLNALDTPAALDAARNGYRAMSAAGAG